MTNNKQLKKYTDLSYEYKGYQIEYDTTFVTPSGSLKCYWKITTNEFGVIGMAETLDKAIVEIDKLVKGGI